MSRKRVNPIQRVHQQFLKHEEPLPSDYWFETYQKGDTIYVIARWGCKGSGNRGSRNLGTIEIVIPYLIDNLDLLSEAARKNLIKFITKRCSQFSTRLDDQIKALQQQEAQRKKRKQIMPHWDGGHLVPYLDWDMIAKIVFG